MSILALGITKMNKSNNEGFQPRARRIGIKILRFIRAQRRGVFTLNLFVPPCPAYRQAGVEAGRSEMPNSFVISLASLTNKKIVVGMSGGVDSSMSLILLKEQGWDPVGVLLKLPVWKDQDNILRENICCTEESINIARAICKKLKVPFHVFDVRKDFQKIVIDYFVSELKLGRTPNPCVICNRYFKFKKLFEWGEKYGIEYVATGHYAKIKQDPKTKKYQLVKPRDKNKDQTYNLSFLPQKWLKYIILPLENYTKEEIYQIAKKKGFAFFLKKKQSQDFCFVAGKSLDSFIKKEIGEKQGLIVDPQGKILGEHKGLSFYTIGQRKGIGFSGGPYFVLSKNKENNQLVITKNKKDLAQKELIVKKVNWISNKEPELPLEVMAKIRYRQKAASAKIIKGSKKGSYKVIFNTAQRAITPGQLAAFYKKGEVIGAGIIE